MKTIEKRARPIWAIKTEIELLKRGIKKKQLAEKMELSPNFLSMLLKGERTTAVHINKICDYLGIKR